MRTAPRMWFLSYAAVSSSTSTSTTFGSSRCASTQSASTSTLLLGICLLLWLLLLLLVFLAGDVADDRPPERADQSQVHLASEAEIECRVQERRDESQRCSGHAQRGDAA